MELDPICHPKHLYDEGGYDLSIIHEALAMTPRERLDALEEMISFVEQVEAHNGRKPVYFGSTDSE